MSEWVSQPAIQPASQAANQPNEKEEIERKEETIISGPATEGMVIVA